MKTKQVFIILSCLIFFVVAGQTNVWAQELSQVQQDKERHQNNLRSVWDRGGVIMGSEAMLRDPEFRDALGVTLHDYREIQKSASNAVGRLADDPEYQKLDQEGAELFRTLWGKEPGWNSAMTGQEYEERIRNADPEVIRRAKEVGQRLESMRREFALGTDQHSIAAFEDALSLELKQKMLEAQLAAMGETSTIAPRLFEVLNLTDAQKQQMERIKKELEPELEKHLEIYGNNAAKILERVNVAIQQKQAAQIPIGDLAVFMRKLEAEPEHKKLLDESYASSKAFATLFRNRMYEILTDAQRKRLQDLIDNPPPHAQVLIQRLRRENWGQLEVGKRDPSGENKIAVAGTDIWVPGPDSWKPGDPIPEGSRQPRNERGDFPRPAE